MFGDNGISDLINQGFDYHFYPHESYVARQDARLATFCKYQTYPENSVAGGGTLVRGGPSGAPGFMWHEFQPPQVIQNQTQILADMLGGGIDTGSLVLQPLISG